MPGRLPRRLPRGSLSRAGFPAGGRRLSAPPGLQPVVASKTVLVLRAYPLLAERRAPQDPLSTLGYSQDAGVLASRGLFHRHQKDFFFRGASGQTDVLRPTPLVDEDLPNSTYPPAIPVIRFAHFLEILQATASSRFPDH